MERMTHKDGNGWYIEDQSVAYDERRRGKDVNRLAAYEDTGLTPERVAELAQAEWEGRLLVLPCKEGDTVWCLRSRCLWLEAECPKDATSCAGCRGHQVYVVEEKIGYMYGVLDAYVRWGERFFRTRQEAEAALERMKEGTT